LPADIPKPAKSEAFLGVWDPSDSKTSEKRSFSGSLKISNFQNLPKLEFLGYLDFPKIQNLYIPKKPEIY